MSVGHAKKNRSRKKSDSLDLTFADLGLVESEGFKDYTDDAVLMEGETGQGVSGYAEDYGDQKMKETHEPQEGEVAMTTELLKKLLSAVSKQTPDDEKIDYIVQGLDTTSRTAGKDSLDVGDISQIQSNMRDAYEGMMKNEPDAHPAPGYTDPNEREFDEDMGGAKPNEAGNVRPMKHGEGGDGESVRDDKYGKEAGKYTGSAYKHEAEGDYAMEKSPEGWEGTVKAMKKHSDEIDNPWALAHWMKGQGYTSHEDEGSYDLDMDDDYADYADYYDYDEDRAEGDGEIAGPEGGKEHEGRPKLMDRYGKHAYEAEGQPLATAKNGKGPGGGSADDFGQGTADSKGKSGTPLGRGKTSGPGGGGQKDLSKAKKWAGKALGTQTGSGPGGGSADDYGQKPSDAGGSNLVPAVDDGSQRGTPQGPWSEGDPNPQGSTKAGAKGGVYESRKRRSKKNRKKLDEAILLGINNIPGTVRHTDDDADQYVISEDDPDAELKMIRRRAGLKDWWKVS